MSTNTSWLKSGVITISDRLFALIFGFGGFFFLVRSITKEAFGVWALFLTITTLIEIARNGLIQNAVIKFLASSKEENHKKIISASLALNIILTSISAICLYCFSGLLSSLWNSPEMERMFHFYIFTTIALIPFSQLNFIQQAHFDFKGIFVSNFMRQGALFGYILYSYLTHHPIELIQLVNFQTLAAILGSCSAYFFGTASAGSSC